MSTQMLPLNNKTARCLCLSLALACLGLLPTPAQSDPLLPDLFVWQNRALQYMHGGTFDLQSEPGRVLYRFNTAIANVGDGPFEVFEVTHPDFTQDVFQNIHDSQGGFTQTLMGSFPNAHPEFGHLFLVGLAQYNLRTVLPGQGVGPVVASQTKTSNALIDSVPANLQLPDAAPTPIYTNVNQNPLGVSVGWADLYSKTIPAQRIDVTHLTSGLYWLEVTADPSNFVQETNETNNTTRILVDLDIPQVPEPGAGILLAAAALGITAHRRSRN